MYVILFVILSAANIISSQPSGRSFFLFLIIRTSYVLYLFCFHSAIEFYEFFSLFSVLLNSRLLNS